MKGNTTSYLSVAGKTIGDLRVDTLSNQHLTVYGGFTPSGSQEKAAPTTQFMWQRGPGMRTTSNFLERTAGDSADGTLPEAPQDNLGAYTLQAGDTLEHIALQVYGDSGLWYLLADANGISDRKAQVGSSGQLRSTSEHSSGCNGATSAASQGSEERARLVVPGSLRALCFAAGKI